jgi:hypothetical protein
MTVNWKPITEQEYDEALGALPPALHLSDCFLLGEPYSDRACNVTGRRAVTFHAYAKRDGGFFKAEPLTRLEFLQCRQAGFRDGFAFTSTNPAGADGAPR